MQLIIILFLFINCVTSFSFNMQTKMAHSKPPILNYEGLTSDEKYNLNWYVIAEKKTFRTNQIHKITVWGKDYSVWKQGNNFHAVNDDCSHRGASLALGKITNDNIMCPYHGYEFNSNGTLCKVPGLQSFTNTQCHNLDTFNVVEKNGWIYLNTISKKFYEPSTIAIFEEPEAIDPKFSPIFLNMPFHAYSRVVSENSLDVMHIGFVHTFGNRENPSPVKEIPPFLMDDYPFHYKTVYNYKSGDKSMAKKVFLINDLLIENEFILPHTTIARVIFGDLTSTVITFAQPINATHSKLFVKTYRNFWTKDSDGIFSSFYNEIGDRVTTEMMRKTVLQDKGVVESIKKENMDGFFNMKFDKLQNVYRTLYKKFVHRL